MILYNEWDDYPAQWLVNLIGRRQLDEGVVDRRSVTELDPRYCAAFSHAHFFAGIGGWALAQKLADWPDHVPLWTASLPCQPFSGIGQRRGVEDERHLWPAFHRLVSECRPPALAGEQVATPAGREWLAGVRADLEALGYAVGAVDLCAAGVGAPHPRQRLYWMAVPHGQRRQGQPARDGAEGALDLEGGHDADGRCMDGSGVVHAERPGLEGHPGHGSGGDEPGWNGPPASGPAAAPGGAGDPWRGFEWVPCEPGKARRIEPGLEPLVDGLPTRVGRVRAYGNAIVPQLAAVVLKVLKEEVT